MRRLYPPYGIQTIERHQPALTEILAAVWACPVVQVWAFVMVGVVSFALGFVTGANCEATRQAMTGALR